MSTELQQLHNDFLEHAKEDARFQGSLLETLEGIKNKLDPDHESYINKKIEEDIKIMKDQMEPLLLTYNGIQFGRQFIVGVSGVVVALAGIGGVIYGAINFLTHK